MFGMNLNQIKQVKACTTVQELHNALESFGFCCIQNESYQAKWNGYGSEFTAVRTKGKDGTAVIGVTCRGNRSAFIPRLLLKGDLPVHW